MGLAKQIFGLVADAAAQKATEVKQTIDATVAQATVTALDTVDTVKDAAVIGSFVAANAAAKVKADALSSAAKATKDAENAARRLSYRIQRTLNGAK